MKDTQLYTQILGIEKPWQVSDVKVSLSNDEVEITVNHSSDPLTCPKCGKRSPGYDKRTRRWRHLDTCQLKTLLVAEVPRVNCAEHGVVTVAVPWSESGSGFTALFEALVIDWLKEASVSAVSTRLRLSRASLSTSFMSPNTSGGAVDKVRRQEHRRLLAQGDELLKGSKYSWLRNPQNMSREQWREFAVLRASGLKTARAWENKYLP